MARFTTRRPAFLPSFLSALAATAVLTTACSGPGGVDLGNDWKGSTTFVLAKVDGLVTVVGINPDKARAQSLAVVPQQSDDDDSVSPQIVQLADGRWLLTVPRKGGKPDRRYEVDRKEKTLAGMTGDERLRKVLPGKTYIAEVAGLPDTGSGKQSSVLVKDPAHWTAKRELKIPGTIGLAASDPASDTVCLAGGTKAYAAGMTNGEVTDVSVPSGLDVSALACPSGRPVLVGSASGGSGAVKASLKREANATTVSVTGGRVDAVTATAGSTLLVAVATGDDTEILELDATTGEELHRVKVKDVAASLDIRPTRAGWLLYTENDVTRVTSKGAAKTFGLPGTLLDS
ncbi:hypothetical protein ACIHFB_31395 [Streptomyces sp. NPDC051963]|uniref:hypothetical protein n=1 Tax=Streptomyces sp. NPDC051963 TaxID=3365678 RepID=UPI0037CEB77E